MSYEEKRIEDQSKGNDFSLHSKKKKKKKMKIKESDREELEFVREM